MFQNNCWTEVKCGNCSMKPGVQWCMKHLYTPASCCSCSTMTRPQWWVGACSNAECRRRLLHPALLVLDQTPPRSWVCTMGFRLCRQTDAQKAWNNLFHQQFKPARFSFFKWSARSYCGKRRRIFFGAKKTQCMMTWYFLRTSYDVRYRPRTLHTAFVRESRFICKCHIFVRTFRWSLWFSSSQPLNLPSEDKKKRLVLLP